MREGWVEDDYLILFEAAEIESATDRYLVSRRLPGYRLLGLRSWDDFIVQSADGCVFTIPTVPLDPKYLAPFQLPEAALPMEVDERLIGKRKWYLKPLVFGGAPDAQNQTWISSEEHVQLVRFWNDQYDAAKGPALDKEIRLYEP